MRFFLHTGVLQNIGPLATRPSMTVFQMLPEMVRPEELLHVIALAEFVLRGQMLKPLVPLRVRKIWKFHTTIATRVVGRTRV